MNMYYAVRMCEVATQAQGSGLKLETSSKELWKKSQKQYDAFSPGPNEWPALIRRCDAVDPSLQRIIMSNIINKVAVIGTGVIGGWIIRCLAHNKKVVAFDKDLKLKKKISF